MMTSTPKARTRPGDGYIESGAENVSGILNASACP
jgi:hypothetical protein